MKRCYLFLLLTISIIISCADNKKPSKATFKNALNHFFSIRPPVISDVFISFPGLLSSKRLMMGPNKASIEALKDANLVSYTGDTVISGVPCKKFDASDFGRKFLVERSAAISLFGNTYQGFIFAKENVSEIVSYSEPADFLGKKVSEVKYKSELTNIADWAKSPKIKDNFTDAKKYLSPDYSTETKTAVFILTSEGWVHERLASE